MGAQILLLMKRLLIFASGTKDGGGSLLEKLVENSRSGILQAEIVAVVSNNEHGGVRIKADALGIPFIFFPLPREAEDYQRIIDQTKADFISLSGWLKLVKGVDPSKIINNHPGPLPRFGGVGMYGHYVHEAVMKAYHAGEVKNSAVTIYFVTEAYDDGPIFFELPVPILPDDTAEMLEERVKGLERKWQSWVTNLVVTGQISWDGKDPATLKVPKGYKFLPSSVSTEK